MVNFFGVIPARYASSRLPGKPLALIGGVPMIQRVYKQCLKATVLAGLVVATDDERVYDAVTAFGGNVVMTDANHPSGTDRCFEAAQKFIGNDVGDAVIINIQGDEPFIDPKLIDLLSGAFVNDEVEIATLIKEITVFQDLFSPDTAKVITDSNSNAIYFSRAPIPFLRNHTPEVWLKHHTFYKHIGIYAYRYATLAKLVDLKPSVLEQVELLEQLRWLENSFKINVQLTEYEGFAVDTNRDLQKANTMV